MGNVITQIGDTFSGQVLLPIYYILIVVIGVVALIVLLVKLITFAISNRQNKPEHLKGVALILVICLVMGFGPQIINFFISLGGGSIPGVNV